VITHPISTVAMKPRQLLLALILAIPALSSCSEQLVRVKPYERGVLAKPVMAESIDPLQKAMTEHAYFSREASFGGGGVGGGGCGCN
jgi:Domain of unknown function (DUF4266)